MCKSVIAHKIALFRENLKSLFFSLVKFRGYWQKNIAKRQLKSSVRARADLEVINSMGRKSMDSVRKPNSTDYIIIGPCNQGDLI